MCKEILFDAGNFSQLFAICTTECDEFYRRAGLREKPSPWSVDEWASEALYARVLQEARTETESEFLSYDQNELGRLLDCLRALIPLANTGRDLVGIGQAIEAVETLRGGRRERNLDIGCGFRAGDSTFEEGLFASIYIQEDGIGLDITKTVYDKNVGSDHESKEFSFPGQFDEWCEVFRQIISRDDAKFSVSFNAE